ncbi:MAG TPA: hemerythrin family protein [Gallionella sp.]|nr:hemerythrin family protein [Gallionella sp.]
MELTWSKQMSVGNQTIDSEHKRILDLVNQVDRVIGSKDIVLFARAFDLLEAAARAHFKNEEKIARAIDYPFEEHDLEHKYILDEFQAIKALLAAHPGGWSESVAEYYFEFRSTWAIDHVMEDDMKMKKYLETYPYDFKPDDLTG